MRKTMSGLALALGLLSLGAVAAPTALIERQELRADRDLSAQIGMRLAAEEMILLTRVQILLGVLTAVGLGGTLLMTAVSNKQMKESIDLARTSAQAELRAYVTVDKFIKGAAGADDEWLCQWSLDNYGLTMATDVRAVNFVVVADGRPTSFDAAEPDIATLVPVADIAPSSGIVMYCDLRDMTDAEKADIYAGRSSIVTAAVVTYRDCFGRQHTHRASEIRYGPGLKQSHFNIAFMHRSPPA